MWRGISAMFRFLGRVVYFIVIAGIAVLGVVFVVLRFIFKGTFRIMDTTEKRGRRNDARRASSENAELRRMKLNEMRRRQGRR